MKNSAILKQLRSSTNHVIVPWGMEGLTHVADEAEEMVRAFPAAFYNIPPRKVISSDAEFIGVVISILKKRADLVGVQNAIKLINLLESMNTN